MDENDIDDVITEFSSLSTIDLEASITRLCADINAATFRQLAMIAEFDDRCGWGDDGVRSCAHWLNWRCGISLVAAREKVRVAHALKHLPDTRKAFASGQLSYSKARAITRVGTVHNEKCLLSYARYGTASHLDKVVRLYRKQYNHSGDLMVDYQQPMFAKEPASDEGLKSLSDEERFATESEAAMHSSEHRQLNCYWDEHDCLIIKARLTPEQGAIVIKAMDAAIDELKEAEPTPVLENQRRTQRHTQRRADALVLMSEALLRDAKVASTTDDRYQVVVHVDSGVLAKEIFEKPDGSPDCYIENQTALPVETARRLSCSCKIVAALTKEGEPLSIGRSSRAISTPIKRALQIRDGRCAFPGCDCHKYLDAHHIVHWANGGETSLDNLIMVCHHHHKLLHEGQYSVRRKADGQLLFRRPDGTELGAEPLTEVADDLYEDLPSNNAEPWAWNGDSMDYTSALTAMATQTRSALKNGNVSRPFPYS